VNLNLLVVLFLSTLVCTSPLCAATISPDSDSSGMFAVMSEPQWMAVTDPRSDRRLAVQTSYFEFRERALSLAAETPFAPRMPRVEVDSDMALTQEEGLRLMTRR